MKTNVDNKLIVSLSTDSTTYSEGKSIFLDDGIHNVIYEKTSTGTMIRFEIDDLILYLASVRVDYSGRIKGYGCTCEDSKNFMGACKHVTASLFHLADANDFNGNKVKTDFISNELSQNFKNTFLTENNFADYGKSKKFITIDPVINFNASGIIFITFKIGVKSDDDISLKNFYVIKNLSDFVKNILSHEYFSYGKELAFVHNINKFDKISREVINIIISEKANIDDATNIIMKNNILVKPNNFTTTKELYISKEGFDKLFAIYNGQAIGDYSLVQQLPTISFHGEIDEEKLVLYKPLESYFVFLGNHFGYIIMKSTIYKVEMECGYCLKFLLDAFSKTNNKTIKFKNEGINDFLSFILPKLSKYNLIEKSYIEEFYLVGYLPLRAVLYLDTNNSSIVGNLEFHYGESVVLYNEPTTYAGYRDRLKEEELVEILSYLGFTFNDNVFELKKNDDIFDFYKDGIYSISNLCEVFISNNLKTKQFKKNSSATNISVSISGNLLEMTLDNNNYTTQELVEALNGYKVNKKYYRLKNGKFVDLEEENIKKTMSIINSLKNNIVDGEINVNVNKSFFINDLLTGNGFSFDKDDAFEILIDKIQKIKEEKIIFNDFMNKTLRHYQKEGINWLKNLVDLGFGAILADEMGLGKTIEIIALIEVDIINTNKPYLIVCPTSLIYNWRNEFLKFSPTAEVELIIGTPSEREKLISCISSKKIYISTYDMVKRDIDFYTKVDFRFVILDEAQNIKNPITISSISAKKLTRDIGIALTGTPIENSLKELWSIFDFVIPGYLNSLTEFQNIYAMPIMNENDSDRTKILRNQISPFILRRFKKDVLLELPDKIETILYAHMTNEQELAYTAFFKEAKGELSSSPEVNQINIIQKLTRLRQISCHPQLFIKNYHGGSGKLDITIETVKNCIESEHRVLLFSQFTSMLSIIKESLDEQNIDYFYLDGKTKPKDRELMCAKFNSGEKFIFLISLKAGGTGLNLTGADVVIHYDPWWNPSVMNQASDRAHRFGQKKVVQVFNIITKDTIEEKIYTLQLKKKKLIDNVLTDEVQYINTFSKEELINLFSE